MIVCILFCLWGRFSDASGAIEFAAHKFALMSASPYFIKLFSGEQPVDKIKVEIKGVEPEAFRLILRCERVAVHVYSLTWCKVMYTIGCKKQDRILVVACFFH